jgi:hypothetical protein
MNKPRLPTVQQVLDTDHQGCWAMDVDHNPDMLGLLPLWATPEAQPSMVDQIHDNYAHGGGWTNVTSFTVDTETGAMQYPGDPDQWPISIMVGEAEVLWVYLGSWVTVMDRATGECRTARID